LAGIDQLSDFIEIGPGHETLRRRTGLEYLLIIFPFSEYSVLNTPDIFLVTILADTSHAESTDRAALPPYSSAA